MRCMPRQTCVLARALSLCVLCAAATASNDTALTGAVVPCMVAMRYLTALVSIHTDMQVYYFASDCMNSSLMRMFVRETSAVLAVRAETPLGFLLSLDQDEDALAQTFVMALIGRHYTAEFKTGQFFEFDTASQILTARMPRCEYQHSFFVMLLFVSIVLLVFALIMQNLNVKVATEVSPVLNKHPIISAANCLQGISIDFATPSTRPTGCRLRSVN